MTLVWRPGYMPLDDPDAADYIAAVEAADELASPGIGALEDEVKAAIHAFVKGCKNDGIWPAIKASCILAGARTLAGALVPLVGTAPDKYGTEAGWNYNRETGLQGNGTDNYLNSNRANSAEPQNNNHNAVYASLLPTVGTALIAAGSGTGINQILSAATRNRSNSASFYAPIAGFIGISRVSPGGYSRRHSGALNQLNIASDGLSTLNLYLFARNPLTDYSNARLSFYSIGEALDLAALDGRVTDLMTAIGAAIP